MFNSSSWRFNWSFAFPFRPLVGLVYGLFLYNKNELYTGKSLLIRLLLSSILVLGVIELLIMSAMLHFLYGNAFIAVMMARLTTKLIMLPIQVTVIYFLSKYIKTLSEKYLYTEE